MSMDELLMSIWAELDSYHQGVLLDFAHELNIGSSKFKKYAECKGGPYDGLRLEHEHEVRGYVYIGHRDGVVALYEVEGGHSQDFVFVKFQKTGEGCMPDIYPNENSQGN
ncbi:MAG: hypothetical protein ACK56W_22015 [Pirellula sp.]|jgi:hypothetical protein|nr:hypothetical protein [Pirellula sp.]